MDAVVLGAHEQRAKAGGKCKKHLSSVFQIMTMQAASLGKERGYWGENQHQIPSVKWLLLKLAAVQLARSMSVEKA